MDSKAAFAFALIAVALGGLVAVATGWLKVANGTITIGQPNAAGGAAPVTSTAPVAGATGASVQNSASGGGWGDTAVPGAPSLSGGNASQAAIAQILTPASPATSLSQIYDSTQQLALVNSIAGDGASINPYGIGIPS